MHKYFITGIGTDVGKTVVSAIVAEALEADYWKPVQAGELEHTDADRVKGWISNKISKIHPCSYALKTPMSPHAAAALEGIAIDPAKIKPPRTKNNLVIEGAGGLLVPINDTETMLDLVQKDYRVIVVSRHYLGSINHTLLTLNELRRRRIGVTGIIFNGDEHLSTESIIEKQAGVNVIGRINQEPLIDKAVISKYAARFKPQIELLS